MLSFSPKSVANRLVASNSNAERNSLQSLMQHSPFDVANKIFQFEPSSNLKPKTVLQG